MQERLLLKLNEKIKSRQIQQRDLARVLGCSQGAVSNLLTGKTKLTVEDFFKISEILEEHPATLLEESTRDIPTFVTVGEKFQKVVCSDLMTFHIFNLLRVPMKEEDLLNKIPSRFLGKAKKSVSELLNNQVIENDATFNLRHCLPNAATVHFEHDENYSKRVVDLFMLSRSYINQVAQMNPDDLGKWQRLNTDALFLNYFTEEQVEEQVAAIRDIRALIRQQQQINRLRKDSKKLILRHIFLSNLEYDTQIL